MKKIWIMLMALLPLGDTTVLVEDGKAVIKRGHLQAALRMELNELIANVKVTHACIHASKAGHAGFSLSIFGIPETLHQRFRNVWNANGR